MIIGEFYNTASFGDMQTVGSSAQDVFIAKYDSTGTSQWAKGSAYNSAMAASYSISAFENRPVIAGDFLNVRSAETVQSIKMVKVD